MLYLCDESRLISDIIALWTFLIMFCHINPLILILALSSVFCLAVCDTDLRLLLIHGANEYAAHAGTQVNTSALIGGFCFSRQDELQGLKPCEQLPAGES